MEERRRGRQQNSTGQSRAGEGETAQWCTKRRRCAWQSKQGKGTRGWKHQRKKASSQKEERTSSKGGGLHRDQDAKRGAEGDQRENGTGRSGWVARPRPPGVLWNARPTNASTAPHVLVPSAATRAQRGTWPVACTPWAAPLGFVHACPRLGLMNGSRAQGPVTRPEGWGCRCGVPCQYGQVQRVLAGCWPGCCSLLAATWKARCSPRRPTGGRDYG